MMMMKIMYLEHIEHIEQVEHIDHQQLEYRLAGLQVVVNYPGNHHDVFGLLRLIETRKLYQKRPKKND